MTKIEYVSDFIEALSKKNTDKMKTIIEEFPEIIHCDYQSMNIVLILAAHAENDILSFIINDKKIDITNVIPYVAIKNKNIGDLAKLSFGTALGKWINTSDKAMQKIRCETLSILDGAIDLDILDESGYNLLMTQIDSSNVLIVERLIEMGMNLKIRLKAFRKTLSFREYAGEVYNITEDESKLRPLNQIISIIHEGELVEFHKNNK
jgi:hypothetical protein